MIERYKKNLKINITSIVFLAISFISVTFAWFAYSGTVRSQVDVNIKSWLIQMSKDGQEVSRQIVISVDEIYPGMESISEVIEIANLGDSEAKLNYEVESVNILDQEEHKFLINETISSEYLEDKISHDYPFKINASLSKFYANPEEEESSEFVVSVSWPLDSGEDEIDSYWGQESYKYKAEQELKKITDPSYEVKPAIQVVINLKAEQAISTDMTVSDYNYNLGDVILYDPTLDSKCSAVSETCLKTVVLDRNNMLKDANVKVLVDPTKTLETSDFSGYNSAYSNLTSSWLTNNNLLTLKDILPVVSKDIISSQILIKDLSNRVIGSVSFEDRKDIIINKLKEKQGELEFVKDEFDYLSTNNCYWLNTEYSLDNAFAIKSKNEDLVKVYAEEKTTVCKVVPVLNISKEKLSN